MIVASLLLIAQAANAEAVPASPATEPPARAASAQAAFNAATQAYEAKKWSEAIRLFDALESRSTGKAPRAVIGAIRLRRGIALMRSGNTDRAEKDLRAALETIAPNDATLALERLDGQIELGNLILLRSDFEGARKIAKAVGESATTPRDRLSAAILGLRSTMFDAGDAAPAYAAEAERQLALLQETNKRSIADVDTLRARLLLNRGQPAAAYTLLKRALTRQGGLDTRINLSDVVTRSDLAIAALLNKDKESAREYLAYTGQGRTTDTPFGSAASMDPPVCGTAGIRPEDVAVVEFGIDREGTVEYAQTMYMSRPSPEAARAFAHALLDWRWQPEALAKIPVFYRALTRVELRCSNAVKRPLISAALSEALDVFMRSHRDVLAPYGQDSASLVALRAEVERRKSAPADEAVPALMVAVATHIGTSIEDRRAMYKDASRRLPAGAPARLRAAIVYDAAMLAGYGARRPSESQRSELRIALADPAFANDPVVAAIFRLTIAKAGYQEAAPADAMALVQAVVDEPRIDKDDPLRTAALLRLATLQAQARQVDAAAMTFAKTGLTASQCALLDTPPAVARSNVSNADFPMEAQRWGFEGWVRFEQDILADGKTAGTRAIVAFPPFVFREAAERMASQMRYEATFRPGAGVGCSANQNQIRFIIQK